MQRLSGDFFVKRTVSVHQENGNIVDLYELPNGQWQFGRGRDATIVRDLEQVMMLDPKTNEKVSMVDPLIRADIAAWLEKTKHLPPPTPVQQGQTPVLAGQTARDQLSQAIAHMPEEAINRLLSAITQVMGPIADSIKQGEHINSHGDGYGQDQHVPIPGHVDLPPPFQLPAGAEWVDPDNHASGYLTQFGKVDEKGLPIKVWHPTPAFDAYVERADDSPSANSAGLSTASQSVEEEMERSRSQSKELVGAGRGGRRSSR